MIFSAFVKICYIEFGSKPFCVAHKNCRKIKTYSTLTVQYNFPCRIVDKRRSFEHVQLFAYQTDYMAVSSYFCLKFCELILPFRFSAQSNSLFKFPWKEENIDEMAREPSESRLRIFFESKMCAYRVAKMFTWCPKSCVGQRRKTNITLDFSPNLQVIIVN